MADSSGAAHCEVRETHLLPLEQEELHQALLAPTSRALGLPPSCSFKALVPRQRSHAIVDAAIFSTHSSMRIPCDTMCQASRRARTLGRSHSIHRFRITPTLASDLNERLRAWALQLEQTTGGVSKTNVGGFQSAPDIFDNTTNPAVRTLHGIISAAIEELGLEEGYQLEARRPAPGCRTHAADAWVNVNRTNHYNALHIHAPDRWSGAYFVSSGAYATRRGIDGSLVFRGGARSACNDADTTDFSDDEDVQPSAADDHCAGEASHSYVAVHPTAGDLILFPGSVPHLVLARLGIDDSTSASEACCETHHDGLLARISVAVNLLDAAPPPPT